MALDYFVNLTDVNGEQLKDIVLSTTLRILPIINSDIKTNKINQSRGFLVTYNKLNNSALELRN